MAERKSKHCMHLFFISDRYSIIALTELGYHTEKSVCRTSARLYKTFPFCSLISQESLPLFETTAFYGKDNYLFPLRLS